MFLGLEKSSLTGLLLTASAARWLATGEETASPSSASASGFTWARAARASPLITSSRCWVQRIPRRRDRNWRCSWPSGAQPPPPQDSTRTCHLLPPLRDLPVPQSNYQRATLTIKGAVDKTQIMDISPRTALGSQPICHHSHRRIAQLRTNRRKSATAARMPLTHTPSGFP